ncbi:MAG: M1 family aminopeptidase [bacterium]
MQYRKLILAGLLTNFFSALLCSLFAQHLPEGRYHSTRERTIDIVHYKAEMRFNFNEQKVLGEATVQFHPLSHTDEFSLDAIGLNVEKVTLASPGTAASLQFEYSEPKLVVNMNQAYTSKETLTVVIQYSCQPRAGMYFQKDLAHSGHYFIHTYGEGGLHSNWLPIYNDVNDKFTTEMVVTVPEPYSVISNGTLLEVKNVANGEQTFHWKQEQPHSNYLIALYVGEFEKGDLPPAFDSIPLSYWVPKGRLSEGAYAFRNTTKMVEFFSNRFAYTYPWEKYDQIAVPDYAIGAMEHTSVTGHRWSVLREEKAPEDFGPPVFNRYHNFWTAEGTISHELAHHWFGDNLTCRNLSYIWLNESFASYCQMLWDEEALGKEALMLDRQVALDLYLEYVTKKNIIRPLEYHYFDKPDDIYNEEHTYLKGAIVLHMLRNILGDDDFFRALGYYLHKHEYASVESNDFKIAIEEATGLNLDWFFEDWVYGAGHPIFKVSYSYLKSQKLLDLAVQQVQPFVEGQDLFILPVELTIATSRGISKHTVWVENEEDHFLIESEEAPRMVSFDSRGTLVAEVRFEKELDELLYQVEHDELPGKIWALRELARRFPAHLKSAKVISKILAGDEFWGLKAEAALQLGTLRTPEAEQVITQAFKSPDYRIRKAAVLALPNFRTKFAEETLNNIILTDPHTDVVATAIVALAKANPELAPEFIRRQLGRPAWYDEITIACLEAFQILGEEALVPDLKHFSEEKYNQHVRMSALNAWKSCAPGDENLHKTLMANVERAPYGIQKLAIEMLGQLHVAQAKPLLEKIADHSGDENLRVLAQQALDEITRVEGIRK